MPVNTIRDPGYFVSEFLVATRVGDNDAFVCAAEHRQRFSFIPYAIALVDQIGQWVNGQPGPNPLLQCHAILDRAFTLVFDLALVEPREPIPCQLRSVGGIGTGLKPPKTARIEQLSSTARDQSIWP